MTNTSNSQKNHQTKENVTSGISLQEGKDVQKFFSAPGGSLLLVLIRNDWINEIIEGLHFFF